MRLRTSYMDCPYLTKDLDKDDYFCNKPLGKQRSSVCRGICRYPSLSGERGIRKGKDGYIVEC